MAVFGLVFVASVKVLEGYITFVRKYVIMTQKKEDLHGRTNEAVCRDAHQSA